MILATLLSPIFFLFLQHSGADNYLILFSLSLGLLITTASGLSLALLLSDTSPLLTAVAAGLGAALAGTLPLFVELFGYPGALSGFCWSSALFTSFALLGDWRDNKAGLMAHLLALIAMLIYSPFSTNRGISAETHLENSWYQSEKGLLIFSLTSRRERAALLNIRSTPAVESLRRSGFEHIDVISSQSSPESAFLSLDRNPAVDYSSGNIHLELEDPAFHFRKNHSKQTYNLIVWQQAASTNMNKPWGLSDSHSDSTQTFINYLARIQPNGALILSGSLDNATEWKWRRNRLRQALRSVYQHSEIAQLSLPTKDPKTDSIPVLIAKNGKFSAPERLRILRADRWASFETIYASDDFKLKQTISPHASILPLFQAAEIVGIPYSAVKLGLFLVPLLLIGLIAVGLKRLFVQGGQVKLSSVFVIYALMSGISYVGLQILFLEKVIYLSGRATLSLVLTLDLFLLTGAVACFLIESSKFQRPGQTLRWILISHVGACMVAYVGLDAFVQAPLSGLEFLWLASGFLFLPAISGGAAFGVFFQIVSARSTRLIPLVLGAMASGALFAGMQTKAIALELGFSIAFSIMLLLSVGMALLAPGESSSDQGSAV